LIVARYLGASVCNSAFHRGPETSTRNTPSAKLSARVRSATADPQTTGHAISGASAGGACRNDCATIFSSPEPACSKFNPHISAEAIRDPDFSIAIANPTRPQGSVIVVHPAFAFLSALRESSAHSAVKVFQH
jgi:hypothetical protein